tara:strand:+ start:1805 stop:2371 length:567 start_codon:yes stop_codon:yes gene_type:complete
LVHAKKVPNHPHHQLAELTELLLEKTAECFECLKKLSPDLKKDLGEIPSIEVKIINDINATFRPLVISLYDILEPLRLHPETKNWKEAVENLEELKKAQNKLKNTLNTLLDRIEIPTQKYIEDLALPPAHPKSLEEFTQTLDEFQRKQRDLWEPIKKPFKKLEKMLLQSTMILASTLIINYKTSRGTA